MGRGTISPCWQNEETHSPPCAADGKGVEMVGGQKLWNWTQIGSRCGISHVLHLGTLLSARNAQARHTQTPAKGHETKTKAVPKKRRQPKIHMQMALPGLQMRILYRIMCWTYLRRTDCLHGFCCFSFFCAEVSARTTRRFFTWSTGPIKLLESIYVPLLLCFSSSRTHTN